MFEPPTHHNPSKGSRGHPPVAVGVPGCRAGRGALTDAGGHGRAALLVALGAAVAGEAGDAVLAGTLPRGLVAGLARRTDGVAVTGWVGERNGGVRGEAQHKPQTGLKVQPQRGGEERDPSRAPLEIS